MEAFKSITAAAAPVPLKDVDTDLIIPAQYLTSISRDGYGQNLFRRLRDTDPNFPLNQPRYAGAQILIADSNFGCGSSREHAVWALQGAGYRVIISKSFADIFYNNSAKNGLLLVTLSDATVDKLLQEAQQKAISLTVDLDQQTVLLPWGDTEKFEYDSFRKHCLLEGLDDIDYIRLHEQLLSAFRTKQKQTVYGEAAR